ncbi:SUMF1/EgtB/PvdO family nonheme iron enzyme [Kovacikia minuta CCNUW1]|uniref:SUMF1/EgtB/PvdO family nonheme iron enzyme n=1 Tax=Kovacikia minuta TaxID=2931930 RepID=UPI001CCD5D6E|nr:SUMF1/EgtB/PvdO family nonheme iron enzyme [Kovacikia minuta]UBF28554.1 SUMF1/EgtB/PvdO family nonheme iron enzyme [Kovacikia minuta CCNUW1]
MNLRVRRLLSTVANLTTLPLVLATASYGQICPPVSLRQAVEQLQNNQKRPDAQKSLTQCGEASVKPLTNALSEPNVTIRLYAAQTLGQIGWEAKSTVPALASASQEDSDLQVRSKAVQALNAIAQSSQTQSDQWQGWQVREIQDLKDLKQQLDTVLFTLEKDKQAWATKAKDLETLRLIRNRLQTQLNSLTDQPIYQATSWAQSNPWIAGAGLLGLVLVSTYGGIFLLRPIWLLKLGDGQVKAIASIPRVGTVLSGLLQGLSPLKYHPRVLDAWVAQQLKTATANFTSRQTVSDRSIHVPLPVKSDGASEMEFGPQTLQPYFQRSRFCLLIMGEGGAGKTSLACQIVRWGLEKKLTKYAILPILIEEELGESDNLLDVVQGYLQVLVASEELIDKPLVEALLRKRRLVVIVDHLSEMAETTRNKIRPANREFPINALLVTSRLLEPLGDAPKVVLEPLRVEGNRLSEFINAYLTARGKRHLFEDEDYFEVCRRLSRMVGQRNITVLLARLYVDQTIEQQEGAGGTLPDSVPELMLSYLNQLNRAIEPANQLDQLQVQQDAQAIAWECLKQTYRPTAAKKADAIARLVAQGTEVEEAKKRLHYLEKRLRLLQTLEPGDKLRIILDPLAEYLAANWLVESYCQQDDLETVWRRFFAAIDPVLDRANETPEAIQGFLMAVRDCCLLRQQEGKIPDWVPEDLARKAGLDPEELRQAQEKRRIRLLISELSAPELEYRIRAAEDLSKRGGIAKLATPNLIGMLENRNQTLEARQAAAQALGRLKMGQACLLKLLADPAEESKLRRSIAESLGRMKAGRAELLQILEDDDQPLPVRQGAARALSLIGAINGEPVPMLVVELQAGEVLTQVKAIPVWREPLTEDLFLDLVAIPGGAFLMGSPPDEEGRDSYKSNYPELEGVDVEKQHRVTIQPFAMSQYPITQAQWRFVAGLPKVDQALEPDPANFKGDDRPIEVVSWYEAIEFCARLSRYTGKTYRLPSEAEWEYACRAGTTFPFHLGETLSTDLANYDGNYTYSDGNIGEYRQKTTDAGSFGIVNAFGLADMHGNVYEWCADYWHPSYVGVPTDGTAWIADGDDRYRVLRGGSWNLAPGYCRSAFRHRNTPAYCIGYIGFRVVSVLA